MTVVSRAGSEPTVPQCRLIVLGWSDIRAQRLRNGVTQTAV